MKPLKAGASRAVTTGQTACSHWLGFSQIVFFILWFSLLEQQDWPCLSCSECNAITLSHCGKCGSQAAAFRAAEVRFDFVVRLNERNDGQGWSCCFCAHYSDDGAAGACDRCRMPRTAMALRVANLAACSFEAKQQNRETLVCLCFCEKCLF